jgi:hypothetical protein
LKTQEEIRKHKTWLENLKYINIRILKWILVKQYSSELNSAASEQGSEAGYCEHSDRPSGSIKVEDFMTSSVTINLSRKIHHQTVSW